MCQAAENSSSKSLCVGKAFCEGSAPSHYLCPYVETLRKSVLTDGGRLRIRDKGDAEGGKAGMRGIQLACVSPSHVLMSFRWCQLEAW